MSEAHPKCAEECGFPRVAQPVQLDERFWALHRKCATGTITEAEMAELDAMCAAKEREYQSQGGAG